MSINRHLALLVPATPDVPTINFQGTVGLSGEFECAHYGAKGSFSGNIPVTGEFALANGTRGSGAMQAFIKLTGSYKAFPYVPVAKAVSNNLVLRYSGGSGNSNPLLSLGGVVSSAAGRFPLSQSFTASTIPGVSILHAAKNPDGTGQLNYYASTGRLEWVTPDADTYSVAISSSGSYAIGDTIQGFIRVEVVYSSLPSVDASCNISVLTAEDSLFTRPSLAELNTGVVEYRSLYLHNQSTSGAEDVVLTRILGQYGSQIEIGSSFAGRSYYSTSEKEEVNFRLFNPVMNKGTFSISSTAHINREQLVATNRTGEPLFNFFPSSPVQSSDGETYDVEPAIADIYDSTNTLSMVEWGNSIYWPFIAPGAMVSFWIRRTVPAGPYTPSTEKVQFDINFTQT